MADPSFAANEIIANLGAGSGRRPGLRDTSAIQSNAQVSSEKQAVRRLHTGWSNEMMAPILLPYLEKELSVVVHLIRELASKIEETSQSFADMSSGDLEDSDAKVKLLIIETEMERLKFVARSYLRVRLGKIDKDLLFYRLSDAQAILSPHELTYVEHHISLLHKLYYSSFLNSWPEKYQDLAELEDKLIKDVPVVSMVDEPEFDKPVAIRVVKTVPEPLYVAPDTLTLQKDEVYILRFSAISTLLEQGDSGPYVELV